MDKLLGMSAHTPHLPERTHLREWQRDAISLAVSPMPYLIIAIVPTLDGNARWFAEPLYSACAARGARLRPGRSERLDAPQHGLQAAMPPAPSAGAFSVVSALRDAGLDPEVCIESAVALTTIRVALDRSAICQ